MSFISNRMADHKWQDALARADAGFFASVQKSMQVLRDCPDDPILSALHIAHWSRRANISDAIAHTVFSSLIEDGRIFLATRPAGAWAAPNRDVEANRAALSLSETSVMISDVSQGYDGQLCPTRPLSMRRLFLDDESTPADNPVAFLDEAYYPLEVGSCTMSKSIAVLVIEGRLARLPYGEHLPTALSPRVYFFALKGMSGREFASEGFGASVDRSEDT